MLASTSLASVHTPVPFPCPKCLHLSTFCPPLPITLLVQLHYCLQCLSPTGLPTGSGASEALKPGAEEDLPKVLMIIFMSVKVFRSLIVATISSRPLRPGLFTATVPVSNSTQPWHRGNPFWETLGTSPKATGWGKSHTWDSNPVDNKGGFTQAPPSFSPDMPRCVLSRGLCSCHPPNTVTWFLLPSPLSARHLSTAFLSSSKLVSPT